ncbi:hypothetical protein MTO96_036123 [Rhipicephalus appendiculatus]
MRLRTAAPAWPGTKVAFRSNVVRGLSTTRSSSRPMRGFRCGRHRGLQVPPFKAALAASPRVAGAERDAACPRTRPGELLLPRVLKPRLGSWTRPTWCGPRGSWPDPGPRELHSYPVGLAATSVSTALRLVAHPCAVNHACRAASALTHVDEHIMPGRRGTQL